MKFNTLGVEIEQDDRWFLSPDIGDQIEYQDTLELYLAYKDVFHQAFETEFEALKSLQDNDWTLGEALQILAVKPASPSTHLMSKLVALHGVVANQLDDGYEAARLD